MSFGRPPLPRRAPASSVPSYDSMLPGVSFNFGTASTALGGVGLPQDLKFTTTQHHVTWRNMPTAITANDKASVHDYGDMELHFVCVHPWYHLPYGLGQEGPLPFKRLSRMNGWLREDAQVAAFGDKLDTRWFTERYNFFGVLRHDVTKIPSSSNVNTVLQEFVTHGQVSVKDVWASQTTDQGPPRVGDTLWLLLVRMLADPSVLQVAAGAPRQPAAPRYMWQLVPYSSSVERCVSPQLLCDGAGGQGMAFRIGTVMTIYDEMPGSGHAEASEFVFKGGVRGSSEDQVFKHKMRRLEVHLHQPRWFM